MYNAVTAAGLPSAGGLTCAEDLYRIVFELQRDQGLRIQSLVLVFGEDMTMGTLAAMEKAFEANPLPTSKAVRQAGKVRTRKVKDKAPPAGMEPVSSQAQTV